MRAIGDAKVRKGSSGDFQLAVDGEKRWYGVEEG
jgi:hypothetical protein